MKIAIATFEFEGLTANGGIGTAYRHMAELLVNQGHEVTIVFAPFNWTERYESHKNQIDAELRLLKKKKIRIELIEEKNATFHAVQDSFALTRATLIYETLKKRAYDIVHACDNCGLIYMALLAKRARVDFHHTVFVVGAHGCSTWAAEANGQFSESSTILAQYDHRSIAMADYLVSPSTYMLAYRRSKGWAEPSQALVLPNVNILKAPPKKPMLEKKSAAEKKKSRSQKKGPAPKHLIFFGRLERRKGVYLFAEAVERLFDENPQLGLDTPFKITFLGRDRALPNGRMLSNLIVWRLSRFQSRMKLTFHSDLSSEQSLKFIMDRPDHLVCMPSLVDNSPYVIVEALERGINFLASSSGGQPELIDRSFWPDVLCVPTVEAWAEAIARRLAMPAIVAQPAPELKQANANWIKLHNQIFKALKTQPEPKSQARQPLVSVFVGLDRFYDEDAKTTLASLRQQDYASIELIIREDLVWCANEAGFETCKTFAATGERETRDLLSLASGKYVLFLEGGELYSDKSLGAWVKTAEHLSHINKSMLGVSGIVDRTANADEKRLVIPIPSDALRAIIGQFVANVFTLWNRSALLAVTFYSRLNLRSESSLRPFVSSALTKGLSIEVIPTPVVRATRRSPSEWWDTEHHVETIQPFMENDPETSDLVASVAGLYQELHMFRDYYYHSLATMKAQPALAPQPAAQTRNPSSRKSSAEQARQQSRQHHRQHPRKRS